MREWKDGWAARPRVRDERRMGFAVIMLALLILAAEVGGVLGLW